MARPNCFVGTPLSRRCVIMVGLPYPNPSDPELQERMRFMDRQAAASSAAAAAGSAAGAAGAAAGPAAAGASLGTPAAAQRAQQAPPPAQHPAHAQQPQQAQQQAQRQVQQQRGAALKPEDGREYYSNLCMKAVNQVCTAVLSAVSSAGVHGCAFGCVVGSKQWALTDGEQFGKASRLHAWFPGRAAEPQTPPAAT